MKKENKDIINEEHPSLVKNWGESAIFLSFNQVIITMLIQDFLIKPLMIIVWVM